MSFFSFTEWSQSQFSIRGQSRTFTPCSKKWQYTMCILSVAIQRKSQHDIKGMLLQSHSFFKKEIAKRPTLKKKYHDFWRKHISRKTKCNWRLLFFVPHAKQPRKIIVFAKLAKFSNKVPFKEINWYNSIKRNCCALLNKTYNSTLLCEGDGLKDFFLNKRQKNYFSRNLYIIRYIHSYQKEGQKACLYGDDNGIFVLSEQGRWWPYSAFVRSEAMTATFVWQKISRHILYSFFLFFLSPSL